MEREQSQTSTGPAQAQTSTEIVSVVEVRGHIRAIVQILRVSARQTLYSQNSKRLLRLARQLESFVAPISTLVEAANARPHPQERSR
jgi:hypothetical protein